MLSSTTKSRSVSTAGGAVNVADSANSASASGLEHLKPHPCEEREGPKRAGEHLGKGGIGEQGRPRLDEGNRSPHAAIDACGELPAEQGRRVVRRRLPGHAQMAP